eukprot:6192416-Pleurochrysis_carterae.AAC.5
MDAMSTRKNRARAAAVVATELEEANVINAVAWTARLDIWQAGKRVCHSCPLQRGPSRDKCDTGFHLSAKLAV